MFRCSILLGVQEAVSDGNDSDKVRIVLGAVGMVMGFEDIQEGRHEIPTDGHPAANFAVVHTEEFAFEVAVIRPVWRRWRQMSGFVLHNHHPKGQLADIVEQSAEISLLFFEVVRLASDTFAEQGGKKAMLPECGEAFGSQTFAGKLHDRTGENQGAQTFRAQEDGSLFNADDAAAKAKKRGIAETEH